jgi:hypothetical protein
MEDQLTVQEREVLNLERRRWKYPGAKETAIRGRFGWSSARYYQVLHALRDRPAAMAHDPVTVKRLSRLRALRRDARRAGRIDR